MSVNYLLTALKSRTSFDRRETGCRQRSESTMSTAFALSASSAGPAHARWEGILRPYSRPDVERLRGSIRIEHTLAERGARRLWELLHTEDYVPALGALTGNQAVQMVRAGLKAIYL